MPEKTPSPAGADYRALGYVDNPFPPVAVASDEPLWVRLSARAASNRLINGVVRAAERSRPVLVTMVEEIPDYYYRVAVGDFLTRTAHDARLDMMTLTIPLDIMRVGRIRGTLTEMAELVAAVDLPLTVAAYLAVALSSPNMSVPEYPAVTADEIEAAARLFADDPRAAVDRFLGAREGLSTQGSRQDEDEALHRAYLRSVPLVADPDKDEEPDDEAPPVDESAPVVVGESAAMVGEAPPVERDPDEDMRSYILAVVRADLSPVVARALFEYRAWGDSIVAQELKITKAPRKTLAAILRLMHPRWGHIVAIYEGFEPWPMLEQPSRLGVLAALTELRWILGETGVMGLAVYRGMAPEVEEQFAGAEQVDWSMPELEALSRGDFALDMAKVQSWLDAAALTGTSPLAADGTELAAIVDASAGDLLRFSLMAEVAFRDAAERGIGTLDDDAVVAGVKSCEVEDGA